MAAAADERSLKKTDVVSVDKLTKMVHFVGTNKEVTAMEYAQIFVDTVF